MDDAQQDRRAAAANRYEAVAAQLELAARHLHRTAEHYRNGDIPRACAHALAARGDLIGSERVLDDLAVEHASRASV